MIGIFGYLASIKWEKEFDKYCNERTWETSQPGWSSVMQNGSQGCPDLCVSVWDFTRNRILAVGTEAKPLLAVFLLCHYAVTCFVHSTCGVELSGLCCWCSLVPQCAADTAVFFGFLNPWCFLHVFSLHLLTSKASPWLWRMNRSQWISVA